MKNSTAMAVVAAVIALSPLSTFAQTFSQASCEQAYSYVGGYTLNIQAIGAGAEELSVNLSHHKGPDGDGDFEPARTEIAKSRNGSLFYTLLSGTLQLNPNESSATLATARGTFKLECKFKGVMSSPVASARGCVNALSTNKNLNASDVSGNYFRGFAVGSFSEAGNPASIVLETQKTVYFYTGTSDISAALYACDKATSAVTEILHSHSIECSDLPKVNSTEVLYSDCR